VRYHGMRMTAYMVMVRDVHVCIFNERISMYGMAWHFQAAFVSLRKKRYPRFSYSTKKLRGTFGIMNPMEKASLYNHHKIYKRRKIHMHKFCHSFNIPYLGIPAISVPCNTTLHSLLCYQSTNESRKVSPQKRQKINKTYAHRRLIQAVRKPLHVHIHMS